MEREWPRGSESIQDSKVRSTTNATATGRKLSPPFRELRPSLPNYGRGELPLPYADTIYNTSLCKIP